MTTDCVPLAAFSEVELQAWADLEERWLRLLEERKKELRIPTIAYQPTDDDVMVFRMAAKEQKTEGGLFIPDHVYEKEMNERTGQVTTRSVDKVLNIGLLLEAGCSARDWMRSHGVLIGDIVKWGRYSGEEENVHWFSGGAIQSLADVLLINVRDIKGSFDLDVRLNGVSLMRRVFVADGEGRGMHIIKPFTKET